MDDLNKNNYIKNSLGITSRDFLSHTKLFIDNNMLNQTLSIASKNHLPHAKLFEDNSFLSRSLGIASQPYLSSTKLFEDNSFLSKSLGIASQPYLSSTKLFEGNNFLSRALGIASQTYLSRAQFFEQNSSLNKILNSIAKQEISCTRLFEISEEWNSLPQNNTLDEPLNIYQESQINIYVNEIIDSKIIIQGSPNLISSLHKRAFTYFINYILIPFLVSCLATYAMEYREQMQSLFFEATTKNEINSTLRSSQVTSHQKLLKDYRVVIVNKLYLRESPDTNANILEELRIGQLIKIIDKSQRSWLFVEVEINGNIEQGWVYRRYTTHFK